MKLKPERMKTSTFIFPNYFSRLMIGLVIIVLLSDCLTTEKKLPYSTIADIALSRFGIFDHETTPYQQSKGFSTGHSQTSMLNKEKNGLDGYGRQDDGKEVIHATEERSERPIFLIRHAESEYNSAITQARRLFQGKDADEAAKELRFTLSMIDPPLTKEGERQVEHIWHIK